MGGEIEHRRGYLADVNDIAPRGAQTIAQRLGKGGSGQTTVPGDDDDVLAAGNGLAADGEADVINNPLSQSIAHHPADIVGPENRRRHLHYVVTPIVVIHSLLHHFHQNFAVHNGISHSLDPDLG